MKLSRRRMLKVMGTTGIGLVLAACAPPAPGAAPAASSSGAAAPAATGTELKIWFHWGGATGEFAQKMIDNYNQGQGAKDNIKVTIETVPGGEYRQKMTAARVAGTPPDVYHVSIPTVELVQNEIAMELPDEEQAYIKDNYIPAAVERMTFAGKVWGYPTEHQAPALIYRKSLLEKAGIKAIPDTTEEIRKLAKELTHEEGGKKYYGFTQWYDNYPATFHFPGIIWRHGGEMYKFEGDIPTQIMVDTPECIEALSWWRGMVDDGSTQVGDIPFEQAWQNGLALMGEIEPWFPFIELRDQKIMDIYEDIGVTHVRAKTGLKPVVQSGGWELIAERNTKHPSEAIKLMQSMMHQPEMPFSHFIVERIGSLPAPLKFPTPIPDWPESMITGYAGETSPITRADPNLKVLGSGEINSAISETVQAVMLKQKEVAPALKELQPKLDEILKRTDGARKT